MALGEYRARRRSDRTPEPRGRPAARRGALTFAIQKHDASRLHYDLRLELDGVMKSWAVPKGPSLDPRQKRLAVAVEDHPIEYAGFEGTIPAGQYGAGEVIVWDRGTWEPLEDAAAALRKGRLPFTLHGEKLHGDWLLVRSNGRMADRSGKEKWLLIKRSDQAARPGGEIVAERPESVVAGSRSRKRSGHSGRSRVPRRPASIERLGVPGPLPTRVAPQLATLVREPPEGNDWLHEIKFDGYRILARIARGKVHLVSRNGKDWTDRFPQVAEAVGRLPVQNGLLDGEVAALEPDGTTRFQTLQNAMAGEGDPRLAYFLFDLLHAEGRDLSRVPLRERKEALRLLLRGAPRVLHFSDHHLGDGRAFLAEACRRGLEGIVSKRADGLVIPARSTEWQKSKCTRRQECVIGGWSEPSGSRVGLGALLLGVHDTRGNLRYCGKVGTGFTNAVLRDLGQRLQKLARRDSPFADPPRGRAHWVEPRLVAEIAFTEWTSDGRLRHPSFQGLRDDKPAQGVRREEVREVSAGRRTPPGPARRAGARATAPRFGPVLLTHPGRVIEPEQGATKQDLALHFQRVAPMMVPEIEDRPLMLRRCPGTVNDPCFLQKHPVRTPGPGLREVEIEEKKGPARYLTVAHPDGLIALVQDGMVEMHVLGARHRRLERPDRLVFDLDPGPEVDWSQVVTTAHQLRERLGRLELETFVKTTGGKGIHVVVPLGVRNTWDDVRAFADAVARSMVLENRELLTMGMARAGRESRILIDTLRNVRASTWVAPWSTRARAGLAVSTPIEWTELTPALQPARFTIAQIERRITAGRNPWARMNSIRQNLTRTMLAAVATPAHPPAQPHPAGRSARRGRTNRRKPR